MVLESFPGLAAWFRSRDTRQGQGQTGGGEAGGGQPRPSTVSEWKKAANLLLTANYICSRG